MLEFLINNLFVEFGIHFMKKPLVILIGSSCAPLLDNLYVFLLESEFIQTRLINKKIKEKPDHFISHTDILIMIFPLTIQTFLVGIHYFTSCCIKNWWGLCCSVLNLFVVFCVLMCVCLLVNILLFRHGFVILF